MFKVIAPNKKVYGVYDVRRSQITTHYPPEIDGPVDRIEFLIHTDRGGWQYVDAGSFKPYEEE